MALPSGQTASSFRRLELGLCARDRQAIAGHLDAVVDRTPATTLAITGEDVSDFPRTENWPAGGVDAMTDKDIHLDRYTYFCGQKPKVTVHLAQGLHNIAPLAVASDVDWPENVTAQGLNDSALSTTASAAPFPSRATGAAAPPSRSIFA